MTEQTATTAQEQRNPKQRRSPRRGGPSRDAVGQTWDLSLWMPREPRERQGTPGLTDGRMHVGGVARFGSQT